MPDCFGACRYRPHPSSLPELAETGQLEPYVAPGSFFTWWWVISSRRHPETRNSAEASANTSNWIATEWRVEDRMRATNCNERALTREGPQPFTSVPDARDGR